MTQKPEELSAEDRALIKGLPLKLDEERGMALWLDPEYAPNQPSVAITRDLLRRLCNAIQSADAEADESHEIGRRYGYEEAVADLDRLTGGDGEYRFCTDGNPARHTPNAEAMKARIVERFNAARSEAPRHGEGELEKARARVAELEGHMRGLLHGLPAILESGGLVDEEGLIEAAWFMLTRPEVEAALTKGQSHG